MKFILMLYFKRLAVAKATVLNVLSNKTHRKRLESFFLKGSQSCFVLFWLLWYQELTDWHIYTNNISIGYFWLCNMRNNHVTNYKKNHYTAKCFHSFIANKFLYSLDYSLTAIHLFTTLRFQIQVTNGLKLQTW